MAPPPPRRREQATICEALAFACTFAALVMWPLAAIPLTLSLVLLGVALVLVSMGQWLRARARAGR